MHRLERLWSSLQERYPSGSLEQCLTHPELHTKETNLTLATKEKLAPVVGWLLDQGFEEDGMTKVRARLETSNWPNLTSDACVTDRQRRYGPAYRCSCRFCGNHRHVPREIV